MLQIQVFLEDFKQKCTSDINSNKTIVGSFMLMSCISASCQDKSNINETIEKMQGIFTKIETKC